MNCDLFMQNIDAYFDDELPESTRLALEEHKKNCVECNLLFESYKEMLSGLNAMNEMDIPFPNNLHDSIMKSVNEVAEQDAKSNSNVPNVIDITSYINESNESNVNSENNVNTNSNKKKIFNSHKSNTLVAGLLTLFVATGAYKTYDSYKNDSLLDDSMLTVDLTDDNSVADSKAQDTPAIEDVQENDSNTALETIVNENTDIQTNEPTAPVDDSANLATTTQEPTKANNANETTSTTNNTNDSSLSTEVSTFSASEEEPKTSIVQGKGVLKSSPRTVTPMSTDADISVTLGNNINFEHFMNYLRNAPALNIQLEEANQPKVSIITVASDNIGNLVDYIGNYPNGDVVIEYLNESLKNLNSHTNFKLKVVTAE